jgi:hypothetical protein
MLGDPDPRLRARAAVSARRAWWCAHRDAPEAGELLDLLERHGDALPRWAFARIREDLLPRG